LPYQYDPFGLPGSDAPWDIADNERAGKEGQILLFPMA
jgi:hypothetical protein